jgi:tetratricopeptide (TPR) repeat protein
MTSSRSRSIVTINLRGAVRGILFLPVVLTLIGAWFVTRWYVGDTVAEYAPGVEGSELDLARLAARWAPGDPFTHFMLGDRERKDFSSGQLADAVREYETAVTLAPNDYRYWMQLGLALEASGDIGGGEKALRRAVDIAPSYSYPRWYFGNLLLREAKPDEAFRELVRAAQSSSELYPQVFNLTWEFFGGDVDQIVNAVCPSPESRARLAVYLAERHEYDKAEHVWVAIDARNRKDLREFGESLKKALFGAGRYHYALEVTRDLEPDPATAPAFEKFTNGGFEIDPLTRTPLLFKWAITSSVQAQITFDRSQAHSGRGSLKIVFKAPTNLTALDVGQIVVVEPNTAYRVECFAKTAELRSGGTPVIQILDTFNQAVLATSTPLPTGTNDWQPITIDFKTKPNGEGVTVRLGRSSCGQDPVCPIFGTVWYDDFNIQRSGAGNNNAGARK